MTILHSPAHTHLSTKATDEGNHSDFRNWSHYFDKHSSYQEHYGHTRTKKLRNLTCSYTNTVAYKRDKSLKDSLVRAIIHSLNLNNRNQRKNSEQCSLYRPHAKIQAVSSQKNNRHESHVGRFSTIISSLYLCLSRYMYLHHKLTSGTCFLD